MFCADRGTKTVAISIFNLLLQSRLSQHYRRPCRKVSVMKHGGEVDSNIVRDCALILQRGSEIIARDLSLLVV